MNVFGELLLHEIRFHELLCKKITDIWRLQVRTEKKGVGKIGRST